MRAPPDFSHLWSSKVIRYNTNTPPGSGTFPVYMYHGNMEPQTVKLTLYVLHSLRDGRVMAFYCKMKLPPLKLTKRPVGSKCTSVVHRGMGTSTDESVSRQDCNALLSSDREMERLCMP